MRLLHVNTLQLESFHSEQGLRYAILSHTWGTDEVSYLDMMNGTASSKAGYKKVEGACKLAASRKHTHIWIDTLCIDKSSSSELSEAINSMYRWYEAADECYAYIEDCPSPSERSSLTSSRWFSRGWTLQELIAPEEVLFYDVNWRLIGNRSDLYSSLARGTGIDWSILAPRPGSIYSHRYLLRNISVAKKMSWASKRTTTRGEDIAYCLLGIFDVNMPLLYGEGQQKAFHRLQELVFRQYDDQSLLAWTDQSDGGLMGYARGWMANHPVEFSAAGSIASIAHPLQNYVVTERGLQISLRILEHNGKEYAVLYCHDENTLDGPLAIHVLPRNNGPIRYGDMVLRYGKPMPFENIEDLDTRSIFIPRHPSVVLTDQHSGQPIRFLRFKGWSPLLELVSAQPSNGWVEDSRTLKLEDFSDGNHRGAMCFQYKPKSMRIVVCVNVFQRNTIHAMINHDEYGSDEQILENMDEENTEYLGRYRPWTEYEQLIDTFSGNGLVMSVNVNEVHVQNNTIGEVTIEI